RQDVGVLEHFLRAAIVIVGRVAELKLCSARGQLGLDDASAKLKRAERLASLSVAIEPAHDAKRAINAEVSLRATALALKAQVVVDHCLRTTFVRGLQALGERGTRQGAHTPKQLIFVVAKRAGLLGIARQASQQGTRSKDGDKVGILLEHRKELIESIHG